MVNIREEFPIFDTNPELVYWDNAATTQKPHSVIGAMVDFYTHINANVHRGLYPLSEAASELYELSRKKVGKFINAAPDEIVFTYGTTDGINMLANMLFDSEVVGHDAKVLVGDAEHHANSLPWRKVTKNVEYIPLNDDFEYDLRDGLRDINPAIVSLTSVSNVTGAVTDIKRVRELFPESILVVDAAHQVAHAQIDVKELDVDFLLFSGHKMYGPTGVGVLYGKKELLDKLEPWRVGGGIVGDVSKEEVTWVDAPHKFEAGTPPIAQVIGLAAAVDFLGGIGWDEIQSHERELTSLLNDELLKIPGLKLFHPKDVDNHAGVFSFVIEGMHGHDIAQLLGERGVAVRAGHHCAQPLHKYLGVPATARVSVGIYNLQEDVDTLASALHEAIKTFKK